MAERKEGIAAEKIPETAGTKEEAAKQQIGQVKAKEQSGAAPKAETAKEEAAPKKNAAKKAPAKGSPAAKEDAKQEQKAQEVKSAVLAGANPNVEFYRISDDLPIHLL